MVNVAKKELLLREIEQIPDKLFEEIPDFIHFLKFRSQKEGLETAIARLSEKW